MRKSTRHSALLIALALLSSFFIASSARASLLLGKSITTEFHYPNQGTLLGGTVVATVVAGVEIAASPTVLNVASIDFSDTFIDLDFNVTANGGVAAFNGWRFYDATNTIPAFTAATLTTSNTTGWSVTFDADNIWLNGSGSAYNVDSTLRIDLSPATGNNTVPTPGAACIWLVGSGVCGLFSFTRRR